jgi:ABC-type antimicrobial peptide transport system permease subunit
MREVTILVAAGVVIGIPCALGLGRFVASLLFDVKAQDEFALAGATILISGITLLAGYLPARRAASINPTVALRYD